MICGVDQSMRDDLERFFEPQAADYDTALAEIRRGRKTSHWIWYIFPQLRGLGSSEYADFFGIIDMDEAKRYMEHPLMRARLIEITSALLPHAEKRIDRIVGYPDDRKIRSCMTLFAAVCPGEHVFRDVLKKYYGGRPDPATLKALGLESLPAE